MRYLFDLVTDLVAELGQVTASPSPGALQTLSVELNNIGTLNQLNATGVCS